MSDGTLERYYREELEERLISYLVAVKGIVLEDAMGGYYCSCLTEKIYEGLDVIQYLDCRVLVRIPPNTEPELFAV